MLSQTPGRGRAAPSVGRLSTALALTSLPVIVCSAETCPWQRPMGPEWEGQGSLWADSDPWLRKMYLALCTETTTTEWNQKTEWRGQGRISGWEVGRTVTRQEAKGAHFLTYSLWLVVDLLAYLRCQSVPIGLCPLHGPLTQQKLT